VSKHDPVIPLAYQRKDAAAALGVKVDTFDRHIRRQLGCVYVNSVHLWPVAELERWLAGATVPAVVSGRNAKRPRAAGTAGGMAHEE
jgi:hypothetical protein